MEKVISLQEIKNALYEGLFEGIEGIEGKDAGNRAVSVINGYGRREGFFGGIAGIFYRIWNAVKAIFGKSDWQLATKALSSHVQGDFKLKFASEDTKHLNKKLLNKIRKFEVDSCESFIDGALQVMVDATYQKTFSSQEALKDYIDKKYDDMYDNFLNASEKKVKKLREEISSSRGVSIK